MKKTTIPASTKMVASPEETKKIVNKFMRDLDASDSVFDCASDLAQSSADFNATVATANVPANVVRFRRIVDALAATYARKNRDYGDSFSKSVHAYGPVAALTRMSDKWNRLENLMLHYNGHAQVSDEAVSDTLLDLATYSIMTYMALYDDKKDGGARG